MSSVEIAVDGMTLDHAVGSLISGGTFTIISMPSTKVKADGSGVFVGPLLFSFAGGDSAGFDAGSVASLPVQQSIPVTAIATKSEGSFVMRLGDSVEMTAQGTISGTPTAVAGDVEIADAGQTVVKSQ